MRLKRGNFWGSPPPVGNFASTCTSAVDLSMANWLNVGRKSTSKTSSASLPAPFRRRSSGIQIHGTVIVATLGGRWESHAPLRCTHAGVCLQRPVVAGKANSGHLESSVSFGSLYTTIIGDASLYGIKD